MNKEVWLVRYGLEYYDKYDVIVETKGYNINRLDHAVEIEPMDCCFDNIHAIDEILTEYLAKL